MNIEFESKIQLLKTLAPEALCAKATPQGKAETFIDEFLVGYIPQRTVFAGCP